MVGKKKENQFDNFIQICKGYQIRNPDIQPRMPHPHFVQHSMAIIIRVRPTEEFKYVAGDHRSKSKF